MTASQWSTRGVPLKAAVVVAVLAVVALAYFDLRREQARALDDFAAEQDQLARSFASALDGRLDDVLRDVEGLAAAQGTAATTIASRLVGDGDLYREIDLFSGGVLATELRAPGAPPIGDSPSLRAARDAALVAARRDVTYVSGPLRRDGDDRRQRLRIFAASRLDGSEVVTLVDGNALFGEHFGNSAPVVPVDSRWLVLDHVGRWIDWNVEGATLPPRWRGTGDAVTPGVAQLLERMAGGGSGAVTLDRDDAAALGLERRTAVAGYAPVGTAGHNWSVAVVASAMRVRDRARIGAWRLVAATALASVLVGIFGAIVAREQRRGAALAEELRLTATTAALRERSEKIVDAIPLGVLSLDAAMRVASANPFLVERGVRAGGVPLADAFPDAAPEQRAILEALVARAQSTRRPAHQADIALRIRAVERVFDAYAVPLERPLPDADTFVALHDLTELRALERNLIRAEKLATIGTLTAGVAHEIGTPLGVISGRAEQLAIAPERDAADPVRKHAASILAQVDKVSTTIRQLLGFARVRPIEGSAITPARLLEQAAALLEHRFRRAKVALTIEVPPTVEAITGDPGQIEQAVVNLLINACDACAPGGRVRARALRDGDAIVIEITDDGCGIPKERLVAVFDPFYTTKKRGQGTGLGLTIASDIVKNHGGTLTLESEVGRGTTARIRLPVAKEAAA